MNYHNITHDDMLNGEGLRTVLWVAGCNHYCKNCQNPITWDPKGGIIFNHEAEDELFYWLEKDYCQGLTLSGGDPMFPENRDIIFSLCKKFRDYFGSEKTIWMYTGYRFEEIMAEPVLYFLDVIVDGEFKEELKDVHYMWAGSTNQGIWRKQDGFWIVETGGYEDGAREKEEACE